MDEIDAQGDTSSLHPLISEIDARSLPYEVLGEASLRVFTGASDVVMTVVPMLADIPGPVGVLAENGAGESAIVMRSGTELFVIRRSPGVWEHFMAPAGPVAILGSWKNGERTRFRRRHGALWMTIPEARVLAEQVGLVDELPAEVPPPPPRPMPEKPSRGSSSRAPRAPRSSTPKAPAVKKVAEPEPLPPLCGRCFTVLPLSGKCDCGG